MKPWRGIIEEFRDILPVTASTPVITLHEGNTPLIPAPALSAKLGQGRQAHVKYEGLNPTGSFKDRGMTVALSLAMERGACVVICASTGNTSAAAAAYAARAGLKAAVLLPENKIALGKLAQALIYGARVLAVRGNFDDCLDLVREVGTVPGVAVVNSINPDRIEGQKTAAWEIVRALGNAPQVHVLPVGNAGNITAYWRGYKECHERGLSARLPRMIGVQAAGSAPLVHGHPIEHPETLASAIRIGNPASWDGAREALSSSNGHVLDVTDEEILEAQEWLAAREGIFVEPASAASIAGLFKLQERDTARFNALIPPETVIACTVTGHGLKDPDIAIRRAKPPTTCDASRDAVLKAMGL
jgi:threonine synthase